jgi:hypothetical protein
MVFAFGCGALVTACGDPGDPTDGNVDCGGIAGLVCKEGFYCDYGGGKCGHGDTLGKCQPKPTECSQECVNICGCDGKTYCNECAAHLAGVDETTDAICDGTPPAVR